jgi:hypothetical protein
MKAMQFQTVSNFSSRGRNHNDDNVVIPTRTIQGTLATIFPFSSLSTYDHRVFASWVKTVLTAWSSSVPSRPRAG